MVALDTSNASSPFDLTLVDTLGETADDDVIASGSVNETSEQVLNGHDHDDVDTAPDAPTTKPPNPSSAQPV